MIPRPSRGASQRLEPRPEPTSSSGHDRRSYTTAWGTTIDQAVSEFQALIHERFGEAPSPGESLPPETPEEAEEARFLMAEYLVGLACPDPGRCSDLRCRRDAFCRHMAYVLTRQNTATSHHPRRAPGAEAVRYAIWVYMSSRQS